MSPLLSRIVIPDTVARPFHMSPSWPTQLKNDLPSPTGWYWFFVSMPRQAWDATQELRVTSTVYELERRRFSSWSQGWLLPASEKQTRSLADLLL